MTLLVPVTGLKTSATKKVVPLISLVLIAPEKQRPTGLAHASVVATVVIVPVRWLQRSGPVWADAAVATTTAPSLRLLRRIPPPVLPAAVRASWTRPRWPTTELRCGPPPGRQSECRSVDRGPSTPLRYARGERARSCSPASGGGAD